MKRFIFIICTLFACLNTTMAQVKISCMDLNLTKWKVVADYTDEWGIHYTGSPKGEFYKFTTEEKIWYQASGRTFTYQYYITDKIPTEFEFNKVGSKGKGRYYIEYNPVLKTFECWKIKEFDKNAKVMTHGYIESDYNLVSDLVHYQMTDETAPTKQKNTQNTPVEPIIRKEDDVIARETSTGQKTSTGGNTSTKGNTTVWTTSTGANSSVDLKKNDYTPLTPINQKQK